MPWADPMGKCQPGTPRTGETIFSEDRSEGSKNKVIHAIPSIRSRLLLAINLPLAVLLSLFLAYDYARELSQRLEEKRIALDEEAKTLLPAITQIGQRDTDLVQGYIDTVCGQMQDADSPGHHIAVELSGETLQAVAHHRASSEILQAMRTAAQSSSHRAAFRETELVVGSYREDGVTVYVSETLKNLHASVMGDILRRLGGIVALGLVAALVVNAVLIRVVSRPLDRLVQTVQAIGAGEVGAEAGAFSTAELEYLATEINMMSRSLAGADRDRRSQMAKARDIQLNLLPNSIKSSVMTVGQIFEPADDVGGDYYDILSLGSEEWLLCVADVAGHGVPAAMTASMLKALLLEAAEQCTAPAEMLHFINRHFTAVNLPGEFVTMVLVKMSPKSGCLTYASAGHEPGWLLQNGEAQRLDSTGMILGVDIATSWDDVTIDVVAGDRLLLVTDGVTETRRQDGVMFGRQRVTDLLSEHRQASVGWVCGRLGAALKAFRNGSPQADDVTVLMVEVGRCR